jgi:hypothetical protein
VSRGVAIKSRRKYARLLSIVIITIAPHLHDVFAQKSPESSREECTTPFSVSQIEQHLLKNDLKEDDLIKQIQLYKVDFALEPAFDRLVKADASDHLRETIDQNPYRPLYFTFPNDLKGVSSYFRVEGCSKGFSNKHLWLFVQREGEIDGIAQHKEVKPESNGKWRHYVLIPEPKEIPARFQIKAVWVDTKSHQDLVSHIQSLCTNVDGERSERCPGVRVPESNVTASVTVIRSGIRSRQ